MRRFAAVLGILVFGTPVAVAQAIEPGLWESTSKTVSIDMPGAPAALLQGMMAKPQTVRTCITAEQIANGPKALFEQSGGQCSYNKFVMKGGRMSSEASCAGGTVVKMEGRYESASYAVRSNVVTGKQGAGMNLVADVTGRRVGPCK